MQTFYWIVTLALFCACAAVTYFLVRRTLDEKKRLGAAACAVHDLKSAANIVLNAAKLQNSQEPTVYTAMQQRQSAYMVLVCENLSQALRTDRQPLALQMRLADMALKVRDVCTGLEAFAGTYGVALEVESRGNCAARFDEQALSRMVQNLVVNAVDASERDAKVRVTVDGETDAEAVTLCVQDEGHGIDEAQLPHIFEAYVSEKESGASSGLGLFCVRQLADRHNAQLDVHSRPGETRFSLRFAR